MHISSQGAHKRAHSTGLRLSQINTQIAYISEKVRDRAKTDRIDLLLALCIRIQKLADQRKPILLCFRYCERALAHTVAFYDRPHVVVTTLLYICSRL